MPQLNKITQIKTGIAGLSKEPVVNVLEFPKFIALIKQAWEIYRQYLKKFIGMYLLLLTPAVIVAFLIGFVLEINHFNNPVVILPLVILLAIGFVLAIIVGVYSMIFLVKDLDKKISVWQTYIQSWRYFWRYLLLLALILVSVGLGFIALVIPGLVLLVWFSQSFYVAAFEDLGGTKALQRSKDLVSGYWWTVLERYLYWLFIVLFIDIFLLLPLVILIFAGVPAQIVVVVQGLVTLVGLAAEFALVPVSIIYTYLVYKNLKSIKDKNTKVADGMATARKVGVVGLVLFYLLLNGILGSIVNNNDDPSASGFYYEFNLGN